MNILGLIPARGGSKGIPGKNIKKLAGKELIKYTIEAGLSSASLRQVVVSTEDENIAEISRSAGASVPFLRPDALAEDCSPTIETVIHALRFFQLKNIFFDAVCLLQPTAPFRTSDHIEQAIQVFREQDADSLISVREVPHTFNPHWVFEKNGDTPFLKIATGEEQIIPRRQELPKAYFRDGSIYITKAKVLLEQHSLYGKNIAHCILDHSPDINIDTMEDWRKAEKLLLGT